MSTESFKSIAARCRIDATQKAVDALRNREIGHPEDALLDAAAEMSLLAMARIFEGEAAKEDNANG